MIIKKPLNTVILAKAGIQRMLLAGICLFTLAAHADNNNAPSNLNMVISVSTDGNYAIATNTNKQVILWNLKDHSYRIIFKNANIYSAYFIKNTNDFMYQNDATNEVVVENINGKTIKTFNPGFPTYGEVITSDLNTYFASDEFYQLYKTDLTIGKTKQFFYYYCGPNYKDETPPPAGMPYDCATFMGSDKLMNLTLTPDNTKLVTSGNSEFFVWDVATTKMLVNIAKNDEQTVAAISPSGSYILTDDIGSLGYYYNLTDDSGYSFFFFTPNSTPETKTFYQNSDPASAREYPNARFVAHEALAMKFIDTDKIITILASAPNSFNYAPLYDIQDMSTQAEFGSKRIIKPIKYLPLIENAATNTDYQENWPLTSNDFSRDQAIDTSPSAHILVMSMAEKNGIIVYKYDPSTQTLTREWAGEASLWDNHF